MELPCFLHHITQTKERETAAPSKTSKAARTKSSSIPTPPVRARSTSTASAGALEKALGKANKVHAFSHFVFSSRIER